MSDLIKREDAIREIAEMYMYEASMEYMDASDEINNYIDDAREFLKDIPTIDAIPIEHINLMNLVEVVRCKECKRSYIEGQTTLYRVCGLHDITTDENNYCSYGEREGK